MRGPGSMQDSKVNTENPKQPAHHFCALCWSVRVCRYTLVPPSESGKVWLCTPTQIRERSHIYGRLIRAYLGTLVMIAHQIIATDAMPARPGAKKTAGSADAEAPLRRNASLGTLAPTAKTNAAAMASTSPPIPAAAPWVTLPPSPSTSTQVEPRPPGLVAQPAYETVCPIRH